MPNILSTYTENELAIVLAEVLSAKPQIATDFAFEVEAEKGAGIFQSIIEGFAKREATFHGDGDDEFVEILGERSVKKILATFTHNGEEIVNNLYSSLPDKYKKCKYFSMCFFQNYSKCG